MKINTGILIMLAAVAAITAFAPEAVARESRNFPGENVQLSVEYVLPRNDVYERQPFPVFVTLKSSIPDIATANMLNKFKLKNGEFSTFQTIEDPGRPYTKKEGNKTYYYFPLNAYMVSLEEKGTYELTGGEYSIGISYPIILNDPFWGPMRSQEVKEQIVATTDAKVKVKRLPDLMPGETFTGSVGKFTIETIIPAGDIFVDEEAVAYVVLRGRGMIETATLPEYKDAFTEGLKLKSVSESREESFDHNSNEMVSEIHLECVFVPTRRDSVEIGEITFDYFDPEIKQYRTAKSKPVAVTVKSTTSKRESISI